MDTSTAKTQIAKYFCDNDGKNIDYEELVEELHIDPEVVFHTCNELVKEDKIGWVMENKDG